MRLTFLPLALLVAALPLAARADDVQFTLLNATLASVTGGLSVDGTMTGTLVIDTSNPGSFVSADLVFHSVNPDVTFDGAVATDVTNPNYSFGSLADTTNMYGLSFLIPPNPLTGYSGGPICSYADICGGEVSGVFFPDSSLSQFLTGSLGNPVDLTTSATPEPSSLVLLGTGVLSLAGAARRRLRKS